MTIKAGDRLPEATLQELTVEWTPGCPTGPESRKVSDLTRGKRIVIFGLPGAFTRTCSGKHLPGYVEFADRIRARGVDEIWCLSVNDAMVMGAWGKDQKVGNKVRMMADGSALCTKAMGLDVDLTERGMGVRSQRYSMLVEDGVVKVLNLEQPGQFEVSGAEKMLSQL
jgi:glutaredoxin/glutathione-dependent peroxiredoxin